MKCLVFYKKLRDTHKIKGKKIKALSEDEASNRTKSRDGPEVGTITQELLCNYN